MDRIEKLHTMILNNETIYSNIVLNYFDQLMSTYNLLKQYNYSISFISAIDSSIILDLHFREEDSDIVKTLSTIPLQNVNIYNRNFNIQVLGCEADTNLVDGNIKNEFILTIEINELLGSS